MIWFQYLTKPTTEFDAVQCKCVITDIPLYAALYGYDDYVQRTLGNFTDTEQVGIVCVICKYTDPPLLRTALDKKKWGFIFYDTHFGNGKSPEGLGQIHTYWMQRWRPYMMFQRQVMNDICKCGPFSYRDDLPSTTLTAQYKFYFNWGGATLCFHRLSKTHVPRPDSISPIESVAQYKSLARSQWDHNTYSTNGTGDGASLIKKLSKECLKNQMMLTHLQQAQNSLDGYHPPTQTSRKEKTRVQRRQARSPRKKRKIKKSKRSRYTSTSSSSTSDSESSGSKSSSSCYNSPKRKQICT